MSIRTGQEIDLGEGMSLTVEEITPRQATEYLRKDKDNREPIQSWITTLAQRQKRGEWMFTGDPIRFDREGYLRDGQHRLKMVQATGIPIHVPVIRGLDPNVFFVLDSGKPRDLATILFIEKYDNSKIMALIIKEIWSYLGNLGTNGVSDQMFFDFFIQHQEIVDSVGFYLARKGNKSRYSVKFYPKALMIAHYLLSRIDPGGAEAYIGNLMYGEEGSGSLLTLRNKLMAWWSENKSGRPTEKAALFVILKTWEDIQAGRVDNEQVRRPTDEKKLPHRVRTLRAFPTSLLFSAPRQLTLLQIQEDLEEPGGNGAENESQ